MKDNYDMEAYCSVPFHLTWVVFHPYKKKPFVMWWSPCQVLQPQELHNNTLFASSNCSWPDSGHITSQLRCDLYRMSHTRFWCGLWKLRGPKINLILLKYYKDEITYSFIGPHNAQISSLNNAKNWIWPPNYIYSTLVWVWTSLNPSYVHSRNGTNLKYAIHTGLSAEHILCVKVFHHSIISMGRYVLIHDWPLFPFHTFSHF